MEIERHDSGDLHKYLVWDKMGSSVVGSATLLDSRDPVLLKEISINRKLRGNGLGSELLSRIVEDFEDSAIEAEIFEARLEWYRRHGFEVEEEKEDLFRVRRTS